MWSEFSTTRASRSLLFGQFRSESAPSQEVGNGQVLHIFLHTHTRLEKIVSNINIFSQQRAPLKIRFREECRFDSDRPHHRMDKPAEFRSMDRIPPRTPVRVEIGFARQAVVASGDSSSLPACSWFRSIPTACTTFQSCQGRGRGVESLRPLQIAQESGLRQEVGRTRRRVADAMSCYRKAVVVAPDDAVAWPDLGGVPTGLKLRHRLIRPWCRPRAASTYPGIQERPATRWNLEEGKISIKDVSELGCGAVDGLP
jgi:hypothetical protein